MSSEISWRIVASLREISLTPDELSGRFFNHSVNTGLYGQFSLPKKQAYIPLALQPNTSYDDRIRRLAKSKGYYFDELKLPYSLHVPELGDCRLLLRFRIFPPGIVSLTARLKLLDKNLSEIQPFGTLFKCRNFRSIQRVSDVVNWSLGLIGSSPTEQVAPAIATRMFVGFHFADAARPEDIPGYWASSERQMVGLLIGTEAYSEMHGDIVESVTQKCRDLNLKSTSEHLLANKQGAILVSPIQNAEHMHKRRFAQAMDLAEIGMVFREFLDNIYPERRAGHEEFLDYIYRIIVAWVTRAEAVFGMSYSNRMLWKFFASEFLLADQLDLIDVQNPWLRREIENASTYFARFGDRWWENSAFAASFTPRLEGAANTVVAEPEHPLP